MNCENNAVSED